ncbi:hypothetical protein [Bacillus paranthracis]|uniref:hypothetical protein n=1 Tax=Bacillus paranthracis TaxID=2026186 RepID=UPI00298C59C7|nr:hypothetical protein [Bacillus paranthracis]
MKQIFSRNKDTYKNAYLNFRTYCSDDPVSIVTHIHNMNVVAEGFRDSALLLIKTVLKDNIDSKADNLIFPILFNTNHSIELYLKTICWTQNLLLNKGKTFKSSHNLKLLLTNVNDLEEELNSMDKEKFSKMLSNLTTYINELNEKIERTTENNNPPIDFSFSRYPLNKDLEPYFYINADDNVTVDLENYHVVFEEIIFKNLNFLYEHYINLYVDKLNSQV